MKKLLLLPLAAFGLFFTNPAASGQAAPASPVGIWDCALGGAQVGLAILQFNADFTLNGTQLIRPNPSRLNQPVDINPRYSGGDPGRQGAEPPDNNNATPTPTNFVGGNNLEGVWGYDAAGKVIGLLDQISARSELVQKSVTNVVDGTNMVVLTNVLEIKFETNAVSFRAIVVPGTRMTLNVYSPNGYNVYRGLPALPTADITGSLYGAGRRTGVPFYEFMNAVPTGDYPNEYFMPGAGAGYSFRGFAIVSRHRRIAVYTETLNLPALITTYTGSFNLTTRRGSIKGRDSNGKNYAYTIVHQPSAP